jgi:hypothetical protein
MSLTKIQVLDKLFAIIKQPFAELSNNTVKVQDSIKIII